MKRKKKDSKSRLEGVFKGQFFFCFLKKNFVAYSLSYMF